MTSSSIPTIFPSHKLHVREVLHRLCANRLLPVQTNVNSMSLPANTSDICCHPKASPWPHTKSRLSKIGQFHESQGHSILPRLCQFLPLFHLWIFQNHSSAHTSTHKGTPWNFSHECHSTSEALKKAFTTAPVLTHWIPDTQITVETDASDYALATVLSITTPMATCTLLHSIPGHFLPGTQLRCP